MQEAHALADRVGLMKQGKMAMIGSPSYFDEKLEHCVQIKIMLAKKGSDLGSTVDQTHT